MTTERRKWFHFGKDVRNSICVGIYKYPIIGFGVGTGEGITFSLYGIINVYFKFNFRGLESWLYKHNLGDREFSVHLGFSHGITLSINLFAKENEYGRDQLKWYFNITDKLKGKCVVTKNVIEERDVLVPMPEKSYEAHVILADWIWTYPRWFKSTMRRCEIEMKEAIPHAGKGENSWDCGDDATFSMTTGEVKNIPEAIGKLVGHCLSDRVRYGGWNDYKWNREPLETINEVIVQGSENIDKSI